MPLMVIDRIIKKSEQTAAVFIDGQIELVLSYDVIFKNGLRKGDTISESLFFSLKEENEKYFIKKKALDLIARRVHSAKELQSKLLQKKFNKKFIDEVISELTDQKIINDQEFARLFIEEKSRIKFWGRSKLKTELAKRGIKKEIIDEVITDSSKTDWEHLNILASKKLNILQKRNYSEIQLKQKLYSFLLSKGFDYDMIKNCLQDLLSAGSED